MKPKIAIIGGGSLRTLGLIHDWAMQGAVADGSVVTVMDLDGRRAGIVGGLARRMPEVRGRDLVVEETTDLARALDGADFVYNVIRVGGVDAMERDTRIGVRYGFHGHDDFGPSAAMIVLRTAPVIQRLTRAMEQHCPRAWLLNFTNPVPFIVRIVREVSSLRVMGLCGGDQNQLWDIPTTLGWPAGPCHDLAYRGAGLDHFSWSLELTHKGRDFYPELLEAAKRLDRERLPYYCRMSLDVLDLYGKWLSCSAHCFHWTHHDEMLDRRRRDFEAVDVGRESNRADLQERMMNEAEQVLAGSPDSPFWEQPALASLRSKPDLPALGIKVMRAMCRDSSEEMMVNMHAPDAVGNLPGDGILCVSACLRRDGPHPLRFEKVPEAIAPLMRQILAYQGALARVAIAGGRRELEAAIFMDPMMRSVKTVRAMLDELLSANRPWLRAELLR